MEGFGRISALISHVLRLSLYIVDLGFDFLKLFHALPLIGR
jgi:hypothetical protein